MRRLAIIASIIGAVAFAALLAWGLTFGSATVQANDLEEACGECAATDDCDCDDFATQADAQTCLDADATDPFELDDDDDGIACEGLAADAEAADEEEADEEVADEEEADEEEADEEVADEEEEPEYCGFAMPTTFAGTVTVDGVPAADGTTITALDSNQVVWATTTTSGGSYDMEVPATPPTIPPCFPGGTISFTCDGASAAETGQAGMPQLDFDLTCGPLATPEPTVEPTVEPTPEVTPTVLPPTGMGGMSGDGGFMWWPLALAAAALTSVAGLFTARWARR